MPVSEIKTRISLEGAEDVKKKLEDITQTGQKAFKTLADAGGHYTASGVPALALKQLDTAGHALEGGGRRATQQLAQIGADSLAAQGWARRVREAMHSLHPIIDATGARFGMLGAFMGATRATAAGFAAALVGTVGVALQTIGTQAENTRKRIEGVFGPLAPKATEQAKQGAQETGRSTGEFAGAMEQMAHLGYLRGPQAGAMTFPERKEGTNEPWTPPPGSAVAKLFAQNIGSPEGQKAFLTGLDQLIRGTGGTEEGATRAQQSLLQGWTKQAQEGQPAVLTPEMVREIYTASPEAARRLAGGLGAISPITGAPSAEQLERMTNSGWVWQPEQVAGAVASLAPQAKKEFEARKISPGEALTIAKNRSLDFAEGIAVGPPETEHNQQIRAAKGIGRDAVRPSAPVLPPNYISEEDYQKASPAEQYTATRVGRRRIPQAEIDAAHAGSPDADFKNAVGEFGRWVTVLGQKPAVTERVKSAITPQPLPDYFPQGPGSGLQSPASAAPTQGRPVPSGAVAPSTQTAAVYRDASGNVRVVQPQEQSAPAQAISPAGNVATPAPAAPGTPVTPTSRQTAVVLRDKDGNPVVIQPDAEGHAEGGYIFGPGARAVAMLESGRTIPRFAEGGTVTQQGYQDATSTSAAALTNYNLGYYDADIKVAQDEKAKEARAKERSKHHNRGDISASFARMFGGDPIGGLDFRTYVARDGGLIERYFGGGYVPPAGVMAYLDGGTVRGPGTGRSDSIVAALEPGGFVLNTASNEHVTRALGAGSSNDQIIKMLAGHADGGSVMARVSNGERYFTSSEVDQVGVRALHVMNSLRDGGGVSLPSFTPPASMLQALEGGGEIDFGTMFPQHTAPSSTSVQESATSSRPTLRHQIDFSVGGEHAGTAYADDDSLVRGLERGAKRRLGRRAGRAPDWYGAG